MASVMTQGLPSGGRLIAQGFGAPTFLNALALAQEGVRDDVVIKGNVTSDTAANSFAGDGPGSVHGDNVMTGSQGDGARTGGTG